MVQSSGGWKVYQRLPCIARGGALEGGCGPTGLPMKGGVSMIDVVGIYTMANTSLIIYNM